MKTLQLLLIGFLYFNFISCQKEESVIIDENKKETLTSTSPLTSLIARVSQNPTSKDNVLDNSSCFKVKLPVTVIVNGQNIVVATEVDYATVQAAIDAFNNDDDIVNFIYPITIEYQNFQTKVISNKSQLDDALDDCGEDDGFEEIDCIKFVFPILINIYNPGSQTPTSITFTNNSDLYNFIHNLNDSNLVEIKYPIAIINPSGQIITIQNNDQLRNEIEDSIDDCHNLTGGGGSGNSNFVTNLTTGTYRITYFYDDNDQTSYFSGYNFTFNSNGTVIAIKATTTLNGTWSTLIDSGTQKLILNFDGDSFKEIEEDWKLIEFNATTIKLKDVSGGNGTTSYLYFTKN